MLAVLTIQFNRNQHQNQLSQNAIKSCTLNFTRNLIVLCEISTQRKRDKQMSGLEMLFHFIVCVSVCVALCVVFLLKSFGFFCIRCCFYFIIIFNDNVKRNIVFPCRNGWYGIEWSGKEGKPTTQMMMLNATWLVNNVNSLELAYEWYACVCVLRYAFPRDVCFPLFILWFKYFIVWRGFSNKNNNNNYNYK